MKASQCFHCNSVARFGEASGRLFCDESAQKTYHEAWALLMGHITRDSTLLDHVFQHLGMKRGREVTNPLAIEHVEQLPDELLLRIFHESFPYFGYEKAKFDTVMQLRESSIRLRDFINLVFFPSIIFLSETVLKHLDVTAVLPYFTGLRRISVEMNSMITDADLTQLTQLRVLRLANGKCTGECLLSLPNLKWLAIDRSSFKSGEKYMKNLTNLERLSLKLENERESLVTDADIALIPSLKKLELSVYEDAERRAAQPSVPSNSTGFTGRCFMDLAKLETLTLDAFGGLSKDSLCFIAPRLRELGLIRLHDRFPVEYLASMSRIESLKLRKTRIDLAYIRPLLETLKVIDIGSEYYSQATMQILQKEADGREIAITFS